MEFKRSLAELEDSVCTIAAFANAEGGTVLFGVRADYPHLEAEMFL
jgi:predicted HTH transcriptional regulator